MRFGSVCSGIEAASVAWHPLGWRAAWLAEIEPFPSAVLAHHYPDVPNHGDMTQLPDRIISGDVEAPDVFCGGTPCQAFSVAGLRKSLDDARGNLSLVFCEIANAIDVIRLRAGKPASVIFWENVPGVLSTADNAFGCFLAGLAGEDDPIVPSGKKWTGAGVVHGPQRTVAWRILDAQYFGVAQRRRRVFVVASARAGFDPAAVLFEFDSLRRDTAPSREAWKDTSGSTGDGVARCITAGEMKRQDWETCNMVSHSLRGEGFDASEDGTGRGTPLVPVAFHPTQDPISSTDGSTHALGCGSSNGQASVAVAMPINTQIATRHEAMGERTGFGIGEDTDPAFTLTKGHSHAVAFQSSQSGVPLGDTHATLDANNGPRRHNGALQGMQVRRLTPVECERLQGFNDNYTAIPWRGKPASDCPDGPRYKALGNSWAVPVVRWIGKRIALAISITNPVNDNSPKENFL